MEPAPIPASVAAASPPPNWVRSRHPLGWLIDRLLAVEQDWHNQVNFVEEDLEGASVP